MKGIYALIDDVRGVPFYIGRSKNISGRIRQHYKEWDREHALGLMRGLRIPAYSNKRQAFQFLALDARAFTWDVLEETDDLEVAERDWIDLALKNGIPLCNGYGLMTMAGTLRKLPCPLTKDLGYGQIATCFYGGLNISAWDLPTLRRLKRDAPELAARVAQGTLSAHAAAIEAGFRQRTVTVAIDPLAFAKAIRKHFTPAEQAALGRSVLVAATNTDESPRTDQ